MLIWISFFIGQENEIVKKSIFAQEEQTAIIFLANWSKFIIMLAFLRLHINLFFWRKKLHAIFTIWLFGGFRKFVFFFLWAIGLMRVLFVDFILMKWFIYYCSVSHLIVWAGAVFFAEEKSVQKCSEKAKKFSRKEAKFEGNLKRFLSSLFCQFPPE